MVVTATTDYAAEPANSRRSPHAAVQPLRLDEVRWTDGFWADRFVTCHERSLPAMWQIMRGTQYKPFLQHFLIAAGDVPGEYHGAQWNDGDFYKFLEAACAVYAVTRDPELERILDHSIDAIARAQRADGYLHTPVLIRARNGDRNARAFQNRTHFEMYNMGHLMTAACVHYRVTGKDSLLAVARKTASFIEEAFREPTPELARNAVCPAHYMGIVELYRTTGEPRYLALANRLFAMRNLVTNGGDDNQDRIPFTQQREAVGHAVRANYLYAGAADLFLETGDPTLWTTLDAIWQNVTERKLYVTGGCGALYDGASPDGAEDQGSITRVHQSYGRNYELPNTSAHNETCAAIGNVLWNWRMFLATGDARYVDVLETSLYNAVLGGVSLDGTDYFYTNPMRQAEPLPTPLRWSRTRVPFVTSYCCPPNVLRIIAAVNGYAYGNTDDTVWVNLYGGSRLATTLGGEPLQIVQQTDYPWDGRVRLTIERCPETEFSLKLRIPGWSDDVSIRINDSLTEVKAAPATYAELRRRWMPGDVISLELSMPVRVMEAHPLVEETRNQVALQRGPVVYCLESPDLPISVRVQDIVVDADANFTVSHNVELLRGITTIAGEVVVRPAGTWAGRLYRPVQPMAERRIKVQFIPYFAWANRSESEMSVWLPVK